MDMARPEVAELLADRIPNLPSRSLDVIPREPRNAGLQLFKWQAILVVQDGFPLQAGVPDDVSAAVPAFLLIHL